MYLRMGNERDMSEGMWLGRLPAPRMGDIGGVGGVRPGPSPDTEWRVVSASTTAVLATSLQSQSHSKYRRATLACQLTIPCYREQITYLVTCVKPYLATYCYYCTITKNPRL